MPEDLKPWISFLSNYLYINATINTELGSKPINEKIAIIKRHLNANEEVFGNSMSRRLFETIEDAFRETKCPTLEELNEIDANPNKEFVYVSIDANGLKVINDTLGHIAGDELIEGAAECLKRALGSYGKIYRTGGDEFVSMIFADENRLELVLKDLEQVMHAWSGVLVKEVSMSVGCATKREFAIETVDELATIAEERMYEAKAKYYSQKGVDRRGQAAAHTALCNLYTKILKINLTTDAYNIVGMDESEQTEAMGFSTKISEWLSAFGKTGQVHKDDLDEYLRQTDIEFLRTYFKGAKTSLSIFYRRKFGDDFKQVMMEIIPTSDYTDEVQKLFFYVKSIE